ncbi:V2R1 protein, partial [Polypterus senegalus]
MQFLLVLLTAWLTEAEESVCRSHGTSGSPQLSKNGDILIGGIFSIHNTVSDIKATFSNNPQACKSLDFRELRFAQTMIFAIEEINNSTEILPDVVLGYKIYDSCASSSLAQKAALDLVNGPDTAFSNNSTCAKPSFVTAIIAESGSSPTIAIARVIGPLGIPLVSHYATCACLSNRKEFPTFFRTIPSDYFQATALVNLVKHFGWSWIGALRSDNDYGNFGMATFIKMAEEENICIEFSEAFYRTNSREKLLKVVDTIKKSTVKVIVTFMATGDIAIILEELSKQNVSGFQWLGSEAWVTDAELLSKEGYRLLRGTLGFAIKKSVIFGLRNFLVNIPPLEISGNSLIKEFWETAFSCTFMNNTTVSTQRLCTGLENLNNLQNPYTDVSQLRISNNVYKAVYAVAMSLHNMLICKQSLDQVKSDICTDKYNIEPVKLMHFLKTVYYTTKNGDQVYFDVNGDPLPIYEIVNWQINQKGQAEIVTVGYYDASAPNGNIFKMTNTSIIWANGQATVPQSVCSDQCLKGTWKAIRKGKPVCCFDCIPCAEGSISNQTDSTECTQCPLEYWPNMAKDQCIEKIFEFLSYEDVLGIILVLFSLSGASITVAIALIFFQHRNTPIVKANNSELSFLLLLSLTLCFLCSITFIGKPSNWSCMLRHTAFGITFVLCLSCVLGKTIVVLMAFRATVPGTNVMKCFGPFQQRMSVFACTFLQVLICIGWLTVSSPYPDRNMEYSKDKIILECNVGSSVAFYVVLGYIGILSTFCFILAFLARKLPDNFNEAKFITFSMLIFCAVWITFIPAYISSPGKYTVAVEIFAILASSFGLLFCIFAPKCYIVLLKPEKNTKKFMMAKMPQKSL